MPQRPHAGLPLLSTAIQADAGVMKAYAVAGLLLGTKAPACRLIWLRERD